MSRSLVPPWGAQADRSFVTVKSVAIGSIEKIHTLHSPGGGRLGAVEVHRNGWVPIPIGKKFPSRTQRAQREVQTYEEAAAEAALLKSSRKAALEKYAASRREAAEHLKSGGVLRYTPGQKYGYVDWGGSTLSARGVLSLVVGGRKAAEEWLDAFWALKEVNYDSGRLDLSVR